MTLDENLRAALTGNKLGLENGVVKIDQKLSKISSILNESIQFIPATKPYQNESSMLKSKYIYINASSVAQNGQNKSQNGQKFGQFSSNLVKNGSNGPDFNGSEPSTSNGFYNNDVQIKGTGPQVPEPQFSIYPPESVRLTWDAHLRQGTAVGLNNLGNTCFLNSVLQILSNTPPLVNFLLSNDHTGGLNCPARTGFCAVCALKAHVKRVYLAGKSRQDSISPQFIVQRLRCVMKNHSFGRQEDAHEFLRYFVDSMQFATLYMFKDRKLDLFTKETSAISRIFGGFHKNDITCLYCNSVSTTFDPFLDISLEIKQFSNIENAFQYFTRVETLSSDNAYKCPKCNKKVSARKSYTIHVPPNILTIQLKRFDHFGKIDKLVGFPEKLNLRPYMSQKQGMPVNYKLYGAVVHSGRSTNSGHYFAFVRNPLDQWHLMDDSRVCVVNAKAVLQSSAYLLFYVRIPLQIATVKPQPQAIVQKNAIPRPILVQKSDMATLQKNIGSIKPILIQKSETAILPKNVGPAKPILVQKSETATLVNTVSPTKPILIPKSETATLISFNEEISTKKLENTQEKLANGQNSNEKLEKMDVDEQKIDESIPNSSNHVTNSSNHVTESSSHVTTEITNQETTKKCDKLVQNELKILKNDEKLAKLDEKASKNEDKFEKIYQKLSKNDENRSKSEEKLAKSDKKSKKRHRNPSNSGKRSHVTDSGGRKSRDDPREKSTQPDEPNQKKRRFSSEMVEKSPEIDRSSHHSHKKKQKKRHVTHRRKSRDHSPKPRDHNSPKSRDHSPKSRDHNSPKSRDHHSLTSRDHSSKSRDRSPPIKQRKKVKKLKKKKEKLKNGGVNESAEQFNGVKSDAEHFNASKSKAEHLNGFKDKAEHHHAVKDSAEHSKRDKSRKELRKEKKKLRKKLHKKEEKSKFAKNLGELAQKLSKPVLTPLEFLKKYCAPVKTWEIGQCPVR